MHAPAAQDNLLNRALSISPGQFEQLCRILIKRSEPTKELELTPRSGDAGIDVHAVIDRNLFQARFGVQAKRNDEGNTVSSDTMRTFKGSLREGDYHVGTFITTSSFSEPAINSAEQAHIRLIDGPTLADIMLQSELGVVQEDDNEYAIDWEFWELFELERGDLLRSDAVPQADNLEVLNIVLLAMDARKTVKPEIHPVMEAKTGKNWRPRQADYYAAAGWALGLVHKDTTDEYDGKERQNWTLSRRGAEYVEHLKAGNEESARRVLNQRIREMEISKRTIQKLERQGSMTHEELEELVHENTLPEEYDRGLKESTSHRRAKSIARYLECLPEIVRYPPSNGPSHHLKGSTYEYRKKGLTDY